MTHPRPRAVEHLSGDLKGWPIAGVKARFRREPCIGLNQNRRFTNIETGALQLSFLFPDGANHTGSCSAFLFDPLTPNNKVKIGEMANCARSDHPRAGKKGQDIPGTMPVTIPEDVPCDPSHCVLQWVWTATHISASNPEKFEHYDNCADVNIIGAKRQYKGKLSPTKPASTHAWSPDIAMAQADIQHIITFASTDGGIHSENAILESVDRIDALKLMVYVDTDTKMQAQQANKRAITLLRNGQLSEAITAFQKAYQLDPGDAEIINNLGYAYMRNDNPESAESFLHLALVFEPERTNAWANLGQNYAKRGRSNESVAAFALAYRFSTNPANTRKFLDNLTHDKNHEIANAAARTLKLKFIQSD